MNNITPYDFALAVDVINDATEHQFGSGPIEDGGSARSRAIRAALKIAKQYPKEAAEIHAAIDTIKISGR